MLTRKGRVMARLERGKSSKNQTVGEETISVTASVTSGGHSKEGMKKIIIGLGEKNSLLLEQNAALQKKVEMLEQDSRGRKEDQKVEAKASKERLKERSLKCNEVGCGRAFAMKEELARHKWGVHLTQRKFICEKEGCGKKFVLRGNLKVHIQTVHQNVRPHSCREEGCRKAFAFRNDLERHIHTVHRKERNFTCEEANCGKKFGLKSNLDRHRRGDHLKVKYNCGECNKEFLRKDNLKVHVKMVHQKDIPHHCNGEECDKTFERAVDLGELVRGVHKRKYVCQEEGCGKSFGFKSNLGRHVKNMHQ